MTYCKLSGACNVNGSVSASLTRCPELCSLVKHFKKNFGRKQPDSMVGEMLKWSAKTAIDVFEVDKKAVERVSHQVAKSVTRLGVKKGVETVGKVVVKTMGPLGVVRDLLDSEPLGHTTEHLKKEIDQLLYLLGESPAKNRQRILKSLEKLKYGSQAIIIERHWGNKSPECYKGLEQFIKDIEKAVHLELRNKGPQLREQKKHLG